MNAYQIIPEHYENRSYTNQDMSADVLNNFFQSHAATPVAFLTKALKEINHVTEESFEVSKEDREYCSVKESTHRSAEKFVNYLPEWLEMPQVFSDHFGRIGFTWSDNLKKKKLYASITSEDEIIWSYIHGSNKPTSGKISVSDSLLSDLRAFLFHFKKSNY